jgi:hypothetical protein
MQQFPPKPLVNHLSISSLRLRMLCNEHEIAKATGFVVEHDARRYLVSNWHVFAGKNSLTGENLNGERLFPNRIELTPAF